MAEPSGNIAQKIAAVMGEVQGISKGERNTSQKFNFRGVDTIMNVVGPVLRKHGVIVMPAALKHVASTYQTSGGTVMHKAVVEMAYTWVSADDGSKLSMSAYGEAADAGDKAYSKAQSVAYRVMFLQGLCIPTDEPDPDSESHERVVEPEPKVSDADAQAIQVAYSFLDDEKKDRLDAWSRERGIAMWSDLTVAQAETLKKSLNITSEEA